MGVARTLDTTQEVIDLTWVVPKLPPRAAAAEEATLAAAPLAAANARAKVPRDLADLMPLPRPLQVPGRLAVDSVME